MYKAAILFNRIAALYDSAIQKRKQFKFRVGDREESEATIRTIKCQYTYTKWKKIYSWLSRVRIGHFIFILLVITFTYSFLSVLLLVILVKARPATQLAKVPRSLLGFVFCHRCAHRYQLPVAAIWWFLTQLWCSDAISVSARIVFSRNCIRRLSRVNRTTFSRMESTYALRCLWIANVISTYKCGFALVSRSNRFSGSAHLIGMFS